MKKHAPSPWEKTGAAVGQLVAEKNAAYGDSFARSGRIFAELFPRGVTPEQMDDMLAITRVIDKLFRIATDRDAMGEDPWRDIAGYALLAIERRKAAPEGIFEGGKIISNSLALARVRKIMGDEMVPRRPARAPSSKRVAKPKRKASR